MLSNMLWCKNNTVNFVKKSRPIILTLCVGLSVAIQRLKWSLSNKHSDPSWAWW